MRPRGRGGKRGASGPRRGENSSLSWSLTVEIKEKYQRAKGGKQQRIQCPLKGQEEADVLCRKEDFVHRPAAALSCWPPTEEWDDMGNVREKWGWRERDQDHRLLTCSQGWCQTVNLDIIRLLHSILWFLPFHNPTAVLSPPLSQVTVS